MVHKLHNFLERFFYNIILTIFFPFLEFVQNKTCLFVVSVYVSVSMLVNVKQRSMVHVFGCSLECGGRGRV